MRSAAASGIVPGEAAATAPELVLDRDSTDAARGVFILLVILHHSASGIPLDPFQRGVIETIVSFHVPSFFLLSALFRTRFDFPSLARRLLVPYVLFVGFYWLLFQGWSGGFGQESLALLLQALLLPTFAVLEAATGIAALWFLPCFFVFLVLAALFQRLPSGLQPAALLLAFLAASASIAAPGTPPYAADVALFCLALGGAARMLLPLFLKARSEQALLGVLALCLALVLALRLGPDVWANFANGSRQVTGAGETLWRFPLVGLLILAAFFAVLAACELGLKRLPWLVALGRISLQLYLVHLLFMSIFKILVAKAGLMDLPVMALARFTATVLVTVLILRLVPTGLQRLVFVR